MAARKRRENETFPEYRANLRQEQYDLDVYLNGRVFYDSQCGTYVRKKK